MKKYIPDDTVDIDADTGGKPGLANMECGFDSKRSRLQVGILPHLEPEVRYSMTAIVCLACCAAGRSKFTRD